MDVGGISIVTSWLGELYGIYVGECPWFGETRVLEMVRHYVYKSLIYTYTPLLYREGGMSKCGKMLPVGRPG